VAETLRATDPETARVVAIHAADGRIVGAGCLIDAKYVLTCGHVVAAALGSARKLDGLRVAISLIGIRDRPTVWARIERVLGTHLMSDVALLEIVGNIGLSVPAVEFARPLSHGGKDYSVMGFPLGDPQGRNVTGTLNAADAFGLVQMDRGGALSVLGGFSGAPVWSNELRAFVGLVVTEQESMGISWCIPSQVLCNFHPDLAVRFRIPPSDRPAVHDLETDDPNLQMFSDVSKDEYRELSAKIKERNSDYLVEVYYKTLPGSPPPRGQWVTFVTYPGYGGDDEDAYELFAKVENGKAEQSFEPGELFTVAAIGDAGNTVLTLDLDKQHLRTRRNQKGS
jgi:Trypsin-like peptidase domain